jgi:hypothetical protein
VPFNGTGTFVRLYNWTNDANNSIPISANRFDGEDNDFASGLSLCLTRDSQGAPTAPLTWAQPLTINVGTDETVIAAGRTGGVNNPQLQLQVADASGGTLNLSTAQTLALAIAGTAILSLGAARATFAQPVALPVGAVGTPSLGFTGDLTSGLYHVGAGDIGIAVSGVEVMDWQAAQITAFNSAIAATAVLQAINTSTTATQDLRQNLTAGSSSLSLYVANQNRATAVLTGGPTAAQAALFTTSAIPLAFGVNNIYAGQIGPTGAWSIPAPSTTSIALAVQAANNTWAMELFGGATSGQSFGLLIEAGTTSADTCFELATQGGAAIIWETIGNGQSFVYVPNAAVAAPSNMAQVGYVDIPQNSQNASYQLILSDRGKHIWNAGSLATLTIPANSVTAFPVGTAITVVNINTALTIALATDTLRWLPSGTTGNRTLAQFGQCTLLKVASQQWTITGVGLS